MAELKFFGYLVELGGSRLKEIRLEKPVSLRDLLPSSFPESNIIVLINDQAGSLDSSIRNEDTVVLMPILSGG